MVILNNPRKKKWNKMKLNRGMDSDLLCYHEPYWALLKWWMLLVTSVNHLSAERCLRTQLQTFAFCVRGLTHILMCIHTLFDHPPPPKLKHMQTPLLSHMHTPNGRNVLDIKGQEERRRESPGWWRRGDWLQEVFFFKGWLGAVPAW